MKPGNLTEVVKLGGKPLDQLIRLSSLGTVIPTKNVSALASTIPTLNTKSFSNVFWLLYGGLCVLSPESVS